MDVWQCKEGQCQCLKGKWLQIVADAFNTAKLQEAEMECGGRIFSLVFTPVPVADYVNVYGLDITKRKKVEEDLNKYHFQLEELIEARTEELTEANKLLLEDIEERKRLERDHFLNPTYQLRQALL